VSTLAPGFENYAPLSMDHTAQDLRPGHVIGIQFNTYGYISLAEVISVDHNARGYVEVCYVWLSADTAWPGNSMPNGFIAFKPSQWVTQYRYLRDSTE
jgi:hypothetical protein